MARFLDPLDLRLYRPGQWITLAQFRYESDVACCTITVPAEFITDLASTPRLPLAYLLAGGRAPGSAVLHDFLYQVPGWDDRELADAIFYEAMGVSQPALGFEAQAAPVRWLMWAAVRSWGWRPWRNHHRVALLNPEWSATSWPESP